MVQRPTSFVIPVLLLLAIGGLACTNVAAPQRPAWIGSDAARTFVIPVGGGVVWREQGVRIGFVAVAQDSRCPEGGECVWAGNALLALSASPGGDFTIRFGPQAGTGDTTLEVVELAGFRYEALALAPIASIGKGPVDPTTYRITVRVTKLDGK